MPFLQLSNVVFKYVCRGDWRHVGRTSQKQQRRINRYVLKSFRNDKKKERQVSMRKCKIFFHESDSAI